MLSVSLQAFMITNSMANVKLTDPEIIKGRYKDKFGIIRTNSIDRVK